MAGLAEADEDLEGAVVCVGGDGDVDLAAVGGHPVSDAGQGFRTGLFRGHGWPMVSNI